MGETVERDVTDTVFADQEWEGRCFTGCRFTDCDFTRADLGADALVQARLSGARIDVDTAIRFAVANGLRVDLGM